MFPNHLGNELCFQISPNPNQQQNIPQDLILDHQLDQHYGGSQLTPNNRGKNRGRRLISAVENGEAKEEKDKRKMMHREIERLRRQEMANLYASLRSLLPLEYIKGKRSISDHMHEAMNYIKQLRRRIDELDSKKEKLKLQANGRSIPFQRGNSSSGSSNRGVIVRPCLDGFEVVFSVGLKEKQSLALSRVLQILVQDGNSVANCHSAAANGRMLHTLVVEVKDHASLNLSELQQRLNLLVP